MVFPVTGWRKVEMNLNKNSEGIFIGVGGNLQSAVGSPRETALAAFGRLAARGVKIEVCSGFWETEPVPASDQPWYSNAVAKIRTDFAPLAVLALLHEIEHEFGRERGALNQARTLDLDLLAYNALILCEKDIVLPHPRLGERAFVLGPWAEIAPLWTHPATGKTIQEMLDDLPPGQGVARPGDKKSRGNGG